MSTQHTPGPWVFNPFDAQIDAPVASKLGVLLPIAQMLWPADEYSEDEMEANGRVMRSAPELLEALEAFTNLRDQFPQSVKLINPKLDAMSPVTITVTKAQMLAAVDAVSKARGQS
jgi:hypothetical protein